MPKNARRICLREAVGGGVNANIWILKMTTELTPRGRSIPPFSLSRPRWVNLSLVACLAIFWAGVILKIIG